MNVIDVQVTESNRVLVSLKQSLVKLEGWERTVTIISSDMRDWDAPEKADILVLFLYYLKIYEGSVRLYSSALHLIFFNF